MRVKIAVVVAFLLSLVAIPACADDFTLVVGPVSLSGQGYGTVFTILSLALNGDQTANETGAVAPTNAFNLVTLGANFGGCSVHSGIDLCGNATNQSDVMTPADLAALGITSTSQFALMYNVNQQGVNLDTFLYAPDPFTVYFYDSSGNELFSASYAGTTEPFPPAGGPNGQGTDGYLFVLNGPLFGTKFSSIASIGMSGTAWNANDGADNWSVVKTESTTPIPEPASIALFGSGLLTLAGMIRRRRKQ